MTERAKEAAERLLATIDGVHCGAPVTPGRVIETADVIAVCEALAERPGAVRIGEQA